jgi:beta-aspartyl-dipeptidase (metallo-type)
VGALITLIKNVETYSPDPIGRRDLLFVDGKITGVGEFDGKRISQAGLDFEELDGESYVATPGIIDPHLHLIGGSGEKGGLHTRTPEIFLNELIEAGATTVVGTLGVDTTTRTMEALVAKVKALRNEGLSAHCWGGGYHLPPPTLTGSIGRDVLFVDEIIGMGEIAIADHRASEPEMREFGKYMIEVANAGMLADKAGVTHIHAGAGPRRLAIIREILDCVLEVRPEWIQVTHVERNAKLVVEGIELSKRGCHIDFDTEEKDLAKWFKYYRENGGDVKLLTASSDAGGSSPVTLFNQVQDCVRNHGFKLEEVLPLVTSNTAKALKFKSKGHIKETLDADVLLLSKKDLEIQYYFAKGRMFVRNGDKIRHDKFLQTSQREFNLNA